MEAGLDECAYAVDTCLKVVWRDVCHVAHYEGEALPALKKGTCIVRAQAAWVDQRILHHA